MSAAANLSPDPTPQGALRAEVVCGDKRTAYPAVDAEVVGLGRRGVVLAGLVDLPVGGHAWAAFTLPEGRRVRPLVQATAATDRGVACRFVHLFPDDRRALDAHHAARATPQGY